MAWDNKTIFVKKLMELANVDKNYATICYHTLSPHERDTPEDSAHVYYDLFLKNERYAQKYISQCMNFKDMIIATEYDMLQVAVKSPQKKAFPHCKIFFKFSSILRLLSHFCIILCS